MDALPPSDRPVADRRPASRSELLEIVTHPAFRLGFIDAQAGRPPDHDLIFVRIQRETPESALKRTGWDAGFVPIGDVAVAQYRYEEGRLLHIQVGLRCRAWGHPDFPPAAVVRFIDERTAQLGSDASDKLPSRK